MNIDDLDHLDDPRPPTLDETRWLGVRGAARVRRRRRRVAQSSAVVSVLTLAVAASVVATRPDGHPTVRVAASSTSAQTAATTSAAVAAPTTTSVAPQTIVMPNVVGMTALHATTALLDAGFAQWCWRAQGTASMTGVVVKQTPAAGASASSAQRIELVVSSSGNSAGFECSTP